MTASSRNDLGLLVNKTVFERISVIGLGYIGLPTAAVFASRGISVVGVDVNEAAVRTINQGRIHIVEPDLDMVVQAATTQGYLRATTVAEPADAFLIAVPTPFAQDHEPDLSFIKAATKAIAPVLAAGNLVVLESTSPVGTTEKVAEWLAQERADLTFPHQVGEQSDIRIAYCPERVLPGHVLRELVENDRVIGGMTERCSLAATALYKTFVMGECIVTNARTAEMCKLTENAFRDVNIAFANELSMICDDVGVQVQALITLANRHPRVNILQPGAGVGGHCIAVDPWFIVHRSPERAKLVRTAREVNDSKPEWVLAKTAQFIANCQSSGRARPRVAVLGLAFKPDIDDLRESPALAIAAQLKQRPDTEICVVEPNIAEVPAVLAGTPLLPLGDAIDSSDVVLILVAHRDFRNLAERLEGKVVIDTVGVLATR